MHTKHFCFLNIMIWLITFPSLKLSSSLEFDKSGTDGIIRSDFISKKYNVKFSLN